MTLMDARCGQGHRSVWRLELVPGFEDWPAKSSPPHG